MIENLLAQARRDLSLALGLQSVEARIEAQALLRHALGDVSGAYLIAHESETVSAEQHSLFESMLERRLKGEPIAYILGKREFYGIDFRVGPDVLVPRPETELLVDLALERIPEKGSFRVLDLGTGSGIVAVSIARHRKNAMVTAVDKSSRALQVARDNGKDLANIRFVESDWFERLVGEHFDLIVSNPPYIPEGDGHLKDLKFEPICALSSGSDGLDSIRKIIEDAPGYLESGGWLLFEHGFDQGASCRMLLSKKFADAGSWRDISGIERVSGGRRLT